jgi:hypothetical protein
MQDESANKEAEKRVWNKPELEVLDISYTKYWEFKQNGEFFQNNWVNGLADFS